MNTKIKKLLNNFSIDEENEEIIQMKENIYDNKLNINILETKVDILCKNQRVLKDEIDQIKYKNKD